MQRTDGRPTLRCLGEDLHTDWASVEHQYAIEHPPIELALPELNHPIVRKAASDFPSDEGDSENLRESISGLSDPVWWKVKIGARWRGAAWVDPSTGQAWLCAAGYRREGEATDFYKEFMADVRAKGPEHFLPTSEDRDMLARELREGLLAEWERQIATASREAAARLLESGGEWETEVVTPGSSGLTIGKITIEVETEMLDGVPIADVVVTAVCLNYAHLAAFQWAEMTALLAVDPREQSWSSLPVGSAQAHSQLLEGEEIARLLAVLNEDVVPGRVDAGEVAHYSHKARLMESTVEGQAVKAVCGKWFVPRQDHLSVGLCPHCAAVMRALPGGQD